ncbi:MAG: hypothetical protein IIZ78_00140 [Clostridiales bacterium]|nr:hypothetical protein [Clostridiales bacterium]
MDDLERIQKKLIKRNGLDKGNPKKKKLPALDKYVIFAFTCLIVFTVVMIIVQTITGITQDTLITCFFASFGGELLFCAMIKRLKLKKEDTE